MNLFEALDEIGVLPAIALDDAGKAVPLAQAMLAGGVNLMEITFRTAAAAEAIRLVAENCPDMIVGAGTVINLEQAKQAVQAGARFIVEPGFSREVVDYCLQEGIDVIPACTTGTEIMYALGAGLTLVKFFPAAACGGIPVMKALRGPFPTMRFLPTGGVNAGNMREYLSEKFVFAVGGTWLTPKDAISGGAYDRITALCKEAVGLKKQLRP